ncbi:peptidylprolyl isomerase [Aestuariicoccus sp. MJ-SS9]|uniref:peptidylprolyl isomerase n=1 Tax=Aestuariicoccus sp. MJ-SS9 TaxID=3079855 RepID=UPI002906D675|nr:peptidylprolyl isomerase [Aestuariicoccus sp. MJ-SS9]MDU8910502.1 peptidylprolyl isomerase [Aestuariicoccus sp. MJ-SS9]
MQQLIRVLTTCLALAAVAGLTPPTASAQGLFSPAIKVNERVITTFEIEQRARMLEVLNAPGDPREVAREQLIDDRLRIQAAQDAGIVPSDQEVLDGMDEFAGRANLTREEFVRELSGAGVAEQTFRDFVRAGLSWRQLVQSRFAGRVQVSEAEIDRALSRDTGGANIRVLLSEIIMPAPPQEAEAVRARAQRISQFTTIGEFSAAAREFSATATRGAGGRLPWQSLNDLPPPLRPIVLGLAPGEVSDPLPIPDAVALFQLRAIEETGYTPPEVAAVEYAMFRMPGGRTPETLARARVLDAEMDRCDDLYAAAKGQPEGTLERVSQAPADIPTDIAFELSKLDAGEISTALTRNGGETLMVLMLCGRTNAISEDVARADLAQGLRNRRIESLAEGYLAQLRAEARIVER